MGNPWTDLVKQTFRTGKKLNVTYSLKDAMIEAKKVYKNGTSTNVTGKKRYVAKKGKRRTVRRRRSRRH
jgi:hypothetical protein